MRQNEESGRRRERRRGEIATAAEIANSKCVFVAQRATTCCKEGRQKSFPMMMATSSQRRRMLHTLTTGHVRRLCVSEGHQGAVLEMSELGGRPQRDELVENLHWRCPTMTGDRGARYRFLPSHLQSFRIKGDEGADGSGV